MFSERNKNKKKSFSQGTTLSNFARKENDKFVDNDSILSFLRMKFILYVNTKRSSVNQDQEDHLFK